MGGALHHLFHRFLGLALGDTDLLLGGGELQYSRLKLKGAVLFHIQHGCAGSRHLHKLHRVPARRRAGRRRNGGLWSFAQLAFRLIEAAAEPGTGFIDPLH